MLILEELWQGNITPDERMVRADSRYAKLSKESSLLLERFRAELSSDGKKAFDAYTEKELQLADISAQDAFVKGIQFGARFILDILREYPTQLPQMKK